ncbi:MAG TPA: terminase small subunit [Patescibacteria group bacterium]
MKNKGGRPTKYDPSMIGIAKEYIDSCSREATELPTIEGLALKLGVDDDQINEWSKKYPGFHAAIKDLKSKQKTQLINDGLYGGKEVNPTMAIFLLKVNHGMVEKTGLDLTTGGEPFLFTRGEKKNE